MKKKFLTVLFVSLAVAAGSYAQGFHVGIKGGANLMKIDNVSFKDQFSFGYNLGGFSEIYFSKKFGIQPEVMWSQNSYKTANNLDEVIPGAISDLNVKLNYLQIPLLVNFRPSKLITFQVGPQFGILIDENKTLLQNGGNAFSKGDLSMLAGAQVNLGALKLGGRYAVGLNDIGDIGNQNDWKSRGWQLYVGLRLF